MWNIFLIIALYLSIASSGYAQELLMRSDKYSTEAYVKLSPALIKSIQKDNSSVTVYFYRDIKEPFSKELNDKFISSIIGRDNQFTFNIREGSTFSVINDDTGFKVVVTKARDDSDILLSYGIEKPFLTETSNIVEDLELDALLNNADRYISEKRFKQAENTLKGILQSSKNDFYRQETLYRLGQLYLLMAENNVDYYINAYETFDDFSQIYPDNFKVSDALLKSAIAKEKAGQIFEAIFTYKTIYDSSQDLETKRIALLKMAQHYKTVGQIENTAKIYNQYLQEYTTDLNNIYSELAKIYYDLKEYDLAFEYYINIPIDEFIDGADTTAGMLHSMAETYKIKKKPLDALKLYYAIFERFPEALESNDAIKKINEILIAEGRNDEADQLLLRIKDMYPEKQSGQNATIAYARKYFDSKTHDYWEEYFADLLAQPDTEGLHAEVQHLLIRALYREKRYNETLPKAIDFIENYPYSPDIQDVLDIREELLFLNLVEIYNAKSYTELRSKISEFSALYPISKYQDRINSMISDIKFRDALALYSENDYKATIDMVEDYIITDNVSEKEMARWLDLLDDTYYRDLSVYFAGDDFEGARTLARQYLSLLPNGKSSDKVLNILKQSLVKPVEILAKANKYPEIIELYEENQNWVRRLNDKQFLDKLLTATGLATYHLDSKDKSRELYAEIYPNNSRDYIMLGLLAGDRVTDFDINSLNKEDLAYIVSQIGPKDYDIAAEILDQYTIDIQYATELKYNLAKSILSDVKRESVFLDIYNTILNNPATVFDGSNDLILDVGLLHYRRNDFNNAIIPLDKYIQNSTASDEKKAEAYYYLGKSFLNINNGAKAFEYYTKLIAEIPDSIFAGIAKGEMEEGNWRQGLDNNTTN